MWRVPILRGGRPYTSKETLQLRDYATRTPVAEVSQSNAGLISRDLMGNAWSALQELPTAEVLARFRVAATHFMTADLPVGEMAQSPDAFVVAQSATTGLPHVLCRQNMRKIEAAMTNMDNILDALTGGLDPAALDAGYGQRHGRVVSYAPRARCFGAVLPANSPGVHALWPPALALKMPVALKPGQREPWTPLRILEALRQAGLPQAGFGYYPCGHDGAGVILRKCGASMLFGAGPTVRPWLDNPQIEIHGPGDSKVLLAADKSAAWSDFLDLIATSVTANGGRSCINASSIRTATHGRELAQALAERLAQIVPRPRDDRDALLAAFPDPAVAHGINRAIERDLGRRGATDMSARYRAGGRLVERDGGVYLLPTVVWCDAPDHPLANQEYLFPFVSVVETPNDGLAGSLGPSLVVTALTEDSDLEQALLDRADVGRLNLGPVPTTALQWDQPHEGNIFAHLYQQRAFRREPFVTAST